MTLKTVLITAINYSLTDIHIENSFFIVIIFHSIFDQIKAALLSRRVVRNVLCTRTQSWMCCRHKVTLYVLNVCLTSCNKAVNFNQSEILTVDPFKFDCFNV